MGLYKKGITHGFDVTCIFIVLFNINKHIAFSSVLMCPKMQIWDVVYVLCAG